MHVFDARRLRELLPDVAPALLTKKAPVGSFKATSPRESSSTASPRGAPVPAPPDDELVPGSDSVVVPALDDGDRVTVDGVDQPVLLVDSS